MNFFFGFEMEDDMEDDHSTRNRKLETISYEPRLMKWIQRASSSLSRNSEDVTARENLRDACQLVIDKITAWKMNSYMLPWSQPKPLPVSDELIFRVLSASMELNNRDMFVAAYGICREKLDFSMFYTVGVALCHFDLDSVLPM